MESVFDISGFLRAHVDNITAGELIQLGKQLGWEEDSKRGKGSHRCLIRSGFRPVCVPCHGLGSRLKTGTAHRLLRRIAGPFEAVDKSLPEQISTQFMAWLAAEQTRFEQVTRQELQNLVSEANAKLRQVEEEHLLQTEHLMAQMLQKSIANQMKLQQQLEKNIELHSQSARAAKRQIRKQTQQIAEEKQGLDTFQKELHQDRTILNVRKQHIDRLHSQVLLEKLHHKRQHRLTLVTTITVAVVVGMPIAPNWLKTGSVLLVPAITQLGKKIGSRNESDTGEDLPLLNSHNSIA